MSTDIRTDREEKTPVAAFWQLIDRQAIEIRALARRHGINVSNLTTTQVVEMIWKLPDRPSLRAIAGGKGRRS